MSPHLVLFRHLIVFPPSECDIILFWQCLKGFGMLCFRDSYGHHDENSRIALFASENIYIVFWSWKSEELAKQPGTGVHTAESRADFHWKPMNFCNLNLRAQSSSMEHNRIGQSREEGLKNIVNLMYGVTQCGISVTMQLDRFPLSTLFKKSAFIVCWKCRGGIPIKPLTVSIVHTWSTCIWKIQNHQVTCY